MRLAIVIPVLDEAAALPAALHALAPLRARGARVIVADGGSRDGSPALAAPWADAVVHAPRGRAAQMNAGARVAVRLGCDALLFLHADTRLPHDAWDALAAVFGRAGPVWGRFDARIDGRHPLLPVVAWLMNRRSRWTGIATGDQAIFVRRALFEAVGGFAPIPLMEDVDLSARLRRIAPPACLAGPVVTAGRRWDQHGAWRTVLLMWRLRAAWALGADAWTLARRYGQRPRPGAAVAVLARAPVAGEAKTRLMPLLGPAGAARAARALLRQTLATVAAASLGPLTLWCAPDDGHRLFRLLRRRLGVATRPQPAGDLGVRLRAAVTAHFADPRARHLPLLLIGTDCPALTPEHLQQAADALVDHDAVLIPAEDGGYVLLGLARPLAGVFDGIAWSTDRVAAQTRQRLAAAGARWTERPPLWDVDQPEDWQRWQAWPAGWPAGGDRPDV